MINSPLWKKLRGHVANASELIEALALQSPPVEVVVICKRLGIALFHAPSSELSSKFGAHLDGYHNGFGEVLPDGSARIVFATNDSESLRRTTVAREIGRILLSANHSLRSYSEVPFSKRSGVPSNKLSDFADELLVPDELLRERAHHTPELLADIFQVSKQLIALRLNQLKL